MKTLSALLLFAVLPLQAFAGNTANVTLASGSGTQSIQITDQKYDPVYGTEDYQTTCTRSVLDHYDNVCTTVYDSVCSGGGETCQDVSDTVCNSSGCTPVSRRECTQDPQSCTQVPRDSCSQQAVYVDQSYECTQTRQIITGYTLVKTFNHTINVTTTNAAVLAQGVALTIVANEDKVVAQVSAPYPAALLKYNVAVTGNADSSDTENLTETLTVDVAASAASLNAFAADANLGLAIGKSALRVSITGAAELADAMNFNVRIQKHRTLWFPTDLVNKDFDSSSLGLTTQGADIKADIGLSKLGISGTLDGSKFSVWVTATLKAGTFLNASDFGSAISKQLSDKLDSVKTSF